MERGVFVIVSNLVCIYARLVANQLYKLPLFFYLSLTLHKKYYMKKNWKIKVRDKEETFNVSSDKQFVYIQWKTGKGDPLWLNYTHNIYNHKVDIGDWIEIRDDTPPPKSNNLFSLDDI